MAVLQGEHPMDDYCAHVLENCNLHRDDIDALITPNLKGWTLARLPRVNLQVLRLAVAEMMYGEENMHSVVINEAVELARKFGDANDYQFVNGILGTLAKELGKQNHAKDVCTKSNEKEEGRGSL